MLQYPLICPASVFLLSTIWSFEWSLFIVLKSFVDIRWIMNGKEKISVVNRTDGVEDYLHPEYNSVFSEYLKVKV